MDLASYLGWLRRPPLRGDQTDLPWVESPGRRTARVVLVLGAILVPAYFAVYAVVAPDSVEPYWLWLLGTTVPLGALAVDRWDDREGRWFWLVWRTGHYLLVLWFAGLAYVNRFAPLYTTGLIWVVALSSVTFNIELRRIREQLYFMVWTVLVAGSGVLLVPAPRTPPLDLITGLTGLAFIFVPIAGWRLALLRREKMFSSLFRQRAGGVLVWRDGRVVACNDRARELFGRSREELIGSEPADLVPDGEGEDSLLEEELGALTGTAYRDRTARFEERLSNGRGGLFWAEVTVNAVQLEEGPFAQSVFVDVSDRRRKEAELDHARAKAERAQRLTSRILANLSHEIRGPLATMRGYAEVLEEEVDAEQRRLVRPISESATRLLAQVDDLLRLARVEAGRRKLDPESVRVVSVVRDGIAGLAAGARERGLEFDVRADADSIEATVDPEALQQIAYNLTQNALKFTKEGRIELRIEKVDTGLVLEVSDTGVGIEPPAMERIFEPFQQIDDGTAREPEGLGLGLSIVRRLVDIQNGAIDVESEPGVGSTFTVFLPEQDPDGDGPGSDGVAASDDEEEPPSARQPSREEPVDPSGG